MAFRHASGLAQLDIQDFKSVVLLAGGRREGHFGVFRQYEPGGLTMAVWCIVK